MDLVTMPSQQYRFRKCTTPSLATRGFPAIICIFAFKALLFSKGKNPAFNMWFVLFFIVSLGLHIRMLSSSLGWLKSFSRYIFKITRYFSLYTFAKFTFIFDETRVLAFIDGREGFVLTWLCLAKVNVISTQKNRSRDVFNYGKTLQDRFILLVISWNEILHQSRNRG